MKRDNKNSLDKKYVHCAIMGDRLVGKTSISESYANNSISESYETAVFDNYIVPVKVAGEEFAINMFDTSAKKCFETFRTFAYERSEVLVLCFSTCDRDTLTSINDLWMPELKRHTKLTKLKHPVILVGTQIDLRVGNEDSEVDTDEGAQLAEDIGADCYVECSAREKKGLREVFNHIVFSALKYGKKDTSVLKQIFRRRRDTF